MSGVSGGGEAASPHGAGTLSSAAGRAPADAALSGRVAVVAGASSGIGAATARALADAGAEVHAAARRQPASGDGVRGHRLDISHRGSVDAFAAEVRAGGRVDIVVVAAGVNVPNRALGALSPEDWDRLVSINLTGAFNVVRAFLDDVRSSQGDVVTIGSVSSAWPDVSGAAYQASKAGMLALTRAAGFEEHVNGVRFTSILPGVVDTPILDNRPHPPPSEMRAVMLQPEDVAAACVFAVSLPPRAHVAELTIVPTALQAVGKTNSAEPPA